jgi:hypothetical protein
MTSEFDRLIEQQHEALDRFAKGEHEPLAALWSRADDVTLGNPFGPFVRGFEAANQTMERAAALYRDGRAVGFDRLAEHVGEDVAYLVEVERFEAKMGGGGRRLTDLPSVHQHLPPGGRRMETRASPRRPDHRCARG